MAKFNPQPEPEQTELEKKVDEFYRLLDKIPWNYEFNSREKVRVERFIADITRFGSHFGVIFKDRY